MSRILNGYDNLITQNAWQTNVVTGTYHHGTDIVPKGKSNGCEILAHTMGEVVSVVSTHNYTDTTGNSYGNYVKIKHPNGYYTLYGHLKDVYVKVGDYVSKGQVIGYMGMTGRATGVHVHFEVFDPTNTKINPTPYIEGDLPNMIPSTDLPTQEHEDDNLQLGDKVLVMSGYLTADSYGGGSHTATYDGNINDTSNIKYITLINEDAPRPYHLSNELENIHPRGWASAKQLRKL